MKRYEPEFLLFNFYLFIPQALWSTREGKKKKKKKGSGRKCCRCWQREKERGKEKRKRDGGVLTDGSQKFWGTAGKEWSGNELAVNREVGGCLFAGYHRPLPQHGNQKKNKK